MTDVILALILIFPALCSFFLKSKGDLAFFSVCTGFVLVELASSDIGNLLHRGNITNITPDTTNLILIFVPVLMTLLLARGHGSDFIKYLSLISALCAGALAVLIAGPFFGTILPTDIANSQVWSNLHKAQAWIISAGALASFIVIWSGGVRSPRKKKSK
jgi:hypothetical protein